MEFFIFLCVVGFVIYCITNSKSANASSAAEKVRKSIDSNPFSLKLEKEKLELNDVGSIDVLSIKVKGIINSGDHSIENDQAVVALTMLSSSNLDTDEAPVLCSIEELQHEDTPFFCHISDPIPVTYGLAGGWDDWTTVLSVPIAALTFSRTGSLSLKLNTNVFCQLSKANVVKKVTVNYHNPENGYLDSIEQRKRGKEVAVSLAVLVAGIDGVRDTAEAEIITGFIRKQIASIEDEVERVIAKQELNKAVALAHAIKLPSEIRTRGFKLADEAAEFSSDIKFMIMELLLDVAGADEVAAKQETDFLNDLAHRMKLDVEEYKNMRDKALPISIYETSSHNDGSQIKAMLGITEDMTIAEKKSQLSKEYRKWNALKNSSDPMISKQAKEMVRAISDLRKGF